MVFLFVSPWFQIATDHFPLNLNLKLETHPACEIFLNNFAHKPAKHHKKRENFIAEECCNDNAFQNGRACQKLLKWSFFYLLPSPSSPLAAFYTTSRGHIDVETYMLSFRFDMKTSVFLLPWKCLTNRMRRMKTKKILQYTGHSNFLIIKNGSKNWKYLQGDPPKMGIYILEIGNFMLTLSISFVFHTKTFLTDQRGL